MSSNPPSLISIIASLYTNLGGNFPITNNPTNNFIQIHLRHRSPTIHYEIIHEHRRRQSQCIYVEIQLEFVRLAMTPAYQAIMTNIINTCQNHFPNGIIGNYPVAVRNRPGKRGALGTGYGYRFAPSSPNFNAQDIATAMRDFITHTEQIIRPLIR